MLPRQGGRGKTRATGRLPGGRGARFPLTCPGNRLGAGDPLPPPPRSGADVTDADQSLSVRDNRTGKDYTLEITDGTLRAADFTQIRVDEDEPGLALYDPGFTNTASCRSAVTFIDGEKGILEYRGYPIEQLAEKSTFLE